MPTVNSARNIITYNEPEKSEFLKSFELPRGIPRVDSTSGIITSKSVYLLINFIFWQRNLITDFIVLTGLHNTLLALGQINVNEGNLSGLFNTVKSFFDWLVNVNNIEGSDLGNLVKSLLSFYFHVVIFIFDPSKVWTTDYDFDYDYPKMEKKIYGKKEILTLTRLFKTSAAMTYF